MSATEYVKVLTSINNDILPEESKNITFEPSQTSPTLELPTP
jgi:hypothetical protein